jgi:hypothetical protein
MPVLPVDSLVVNKKYRIYDPSNPVSQEGIFKGIDERGYGTYLVFQIGTSNIYISPTYYKIYNINATDYPAITSSSPTTSSSAAAHSAPTTSSSTSILSNVTKHGFMDNHHSYYDIGNGGEDQYSIWGKGGKRYKSKHYRKTHKQRKHKIHKSRKSQKRRS